MFDILENLYKNTSLTFEGNTFTTTSGVRQGGPESPFIFNLYVDFVMRVFLEQSENANFFEHRYRVNPRSFTREERYALRNEQINLNGSSVLPWCGYADDLVLFLIDLNSLHISAGLLNNVFEKFGLTINKAKTETMIINYDATNAIAYPETITSIDGTPLNNVRKFKYLGCHIDCIEPSTGDTEINHRIQVAMLKFTEMSNLLQNFQINLKTRVKFLNSFVRSRLTYSCQNWNLTKHQQDRIDTTYRRFLRRMVRNGLKHVNELENDFRMVISNDHLNAICGVEDVSIFVKDQQRKYIAHVVRMKIHRNVKKLTFNDDTSKKRGRPVKSLIDQVTDGMNVDVDRFCNYALGKENSL